MESRIQRETAATIKLCITVMEELASLPPEQANEPYFFQAKRAQVISKIHRLVQEARRNDHSG
jgi:hypothetical protein